MHRLSSGPGAFAERGHAGGPDPAGTLRVVTYNIWGTGTPHAYWRGRSVLRGALPGAAILAEPDETRVWRRRRALLAQALSAAAPDIVALQEVPGEAGEGSRAHEIAGDLWGTRDHAVVLSAPRPGGRLAVLSRYPVERHAERALRAAARGFGGQPALFEVVTPVATIWVAHLPVGPEDVNAACLEEIAGHAAAADQDRPLLVCGDFNTPAGGPALCRILAAGALADAWRGAGGPPHALTMPLPDPTWRLDHLLYRGSDPIRPVAGAALLGTEPDDTGLFASDHRGVLVPFGGV